VQAPDGTYWLGGDTEGGNSADNEEVSYLNATRHVWLQQRDSLGAALQTQSVYSSRRYWLRSLDLSAGTTPALVAAGTVTSGNASYVLTPHNPLDADFFFAKVGGVELGGPGEDYLGEARVTPDQGAILGGTSRSGVGRAKSEPSRGGADFWLLKLSRTLARSWDHRFGGSGLDSLVSVRRTPDGGYLLAGSTTSPADGDLTEPSRGGADYWLVKVNSVGGLQWQHRYGGPGDDWLAAARPTPDGGYVLAGTTSSAAGGELSEASRGRRDVWVVKVSSSGVLQWQHRYGGPGNEYAATLENDPDGGYLIGASTTSPAAGEVGQPSWGGTDYWLLRLSAQGTVLWDQRLGGSGEDVLTCLTTTKGYGYALGGFSNSPTGSGEHQQANKGSYDYWTLVLGARRVPAPVISAFTPSRGLPGTQVVLTGSSFTGTSSVQFNGVEAADFVVSNEGTTITVTLPAGAMTGLLTVTANGRATSATAFEVPTAPLPVQLTHFMVHIKDVGAILQWATASEWNNDRFEVEVSTDGTSFTLLGIVASHGSSSQAQQYVYQDSNLDRYAAPLLYYRLRQVDTTGKTTYSPVRAVPSALTSRGLHLFPNPTRQLTTLRGARPGAPVRVLNTLGQVVLATTADAAGETPLVLPAGVAAGVYAVRTDNQVVRLVIE
jgi:hypothetical protein